MIVTFCGHKDVPNADKVSAKLLFTLQNLIGERANSFLFGGYGAFDLLAAASVKKLQSEFPHIRSTLVLAYLNRDYDQTLYDNTVYPSLEKVPPKYAISRRNNWMVDQADVVIAYVTHGWGGAAATLRYAERKKKRIIRLTI